MRTHQHTNATKTAIGYVRVITQEQATDGVNLDAQRDRLRAYCKLNGIKLIDIKADEGYSGSTFERPALQSAQQMLRRGRGNTATSAWCASFPLSPRPACETASFSMRISSVLLGYCLVGSGSAASRRQARCRIRAFRARGARRDFTANSHGRGAWRLPAADALKPGVEAQTQLALFRAMRQARKRSGERSSQLVLSKQEAERQREEQRQALMRASETAETQAQNMQSLQSALNIAQQKLAESETLRLTAEARASWGTPSEVRSARKRAERHVDPRHGQNRDDKADDEIAVAVARTS